mgnify:CR=1 FL=1
MTAIFTDSLQPTISYFNSCNYGNFDIFLPTTNFFNAGREYDLLQLDTFLSGGTSSHIIQPFSTIWRFENTSEVWTELPHLFSLNLIDDTGITAGKYRFSFYINHTTREAGILTYDNTGDVVITDTKVTMVPAAANLQKHNTNFTITLSPSSIGLFISYLNQSYETTETLFLYAGIADDLNTTANYFTSTYESRFFSIVSNSTANLGKFYLGDSSRNLHNQYDYPIVCEDAQVPWTRWLSDFLLFENNITLNNPCLGLARTLILGTGSPYTIGKPVLINGATVPFISQSQAYIPVGKWGTNRTILLKTLLKE